MKMSKQKNYYHYKNYYKLVRMENAIKNTMKSDQVKQNTKNAYKKRK